jgi:hypothetical protein
MNIFERFLAWIGSLLFVNVRRNIDLDLDRIERRLDERLNPKPRRTAYVILQSSAGMMSSRVDLTPDVYTMVRFMAQAPIPKGAWIFVIGDAFIESASVGNRSQFLSHPTESPFCVTQDDAEAGVYVSVRVKGIQ